MKKLPSRLLLLAVLSMASAACTAFAQGDTKDKGENVKGYLHRIDAQVRVEEDNGTLAGTEATCTVFYKVRDRDGMSGSKAEEDKSGKLSAFKMVATGASGKRGSEGKIGPERVDSDRNCHPAKDFSASLTKVSCEFPRAGGKMTLEFTTDPADRQHMQRVKGLKGEDREGWAPVKFPPEKYRDAKGHEHTAPPRTGRAQAWAGKGGSITGGGRGSASLSATFFLSGRACAADEAAQ